MVIICKVERPNTHENCTLKFSPPFFFAMISSSDKSAMMRCAELRTWDAAAHNFYFMKWFSKKNYFQGKNPHNMFTIIFLYSHCHIYYVLARPTFSLSNWPIIILRIYYMAASCAGSTPKHIDSECSSDHFWQKGNDDVITQVCCDTDLINTVKWGSVKHVRVFWISRFVRVVRHIVGTFVDRLGILPQHVHVWGSHVWTSQK